MRDRRHHRGPGAALFAALLGVAAGAAPQSSGGPYEIRAHAVASGGPATGGTYAVHGAAGQSSAGSASGGPYSATLGVLRRRAPLPDVVFANGFE